MGPYPFTDLIVDQTLKEWFTSSQELFAELYIPHNGGSGNYYILKDFSQYLKLILSARPGSICFIFRDKQVPLRGKVDDAFIQKALDGLIDGDYYIITDSSHYPQCISYYGDGNTHQELKQDLLELRGVEVCVGQDFNPPVEYWKTDSTPNFLIITKPS
jgi:hypothetical protein